MNTKFAKALVPIKIRKSPNIQAEYLGTIEVGETVEILEDNLTWIRHSRGWSVKKYFSKDIETKLEEGNNPPINTTSIIDAVADATGLSKTLSTVKGVLGTVTGGVGDRVDTSKGLRGLWGMPFAFTDITDPIPGTVRRTGGADSNGNKWHYGRVYSETILSDLPILVMTAGVPSFMTQASESDKQVIFAELAAGGDIEGGIGDFMASQMNTGGLEYFTFKEAMIEYYGYVNFMCRSMASFLNLSKDDFTGKVLSTFASSIFGATVDLTTSNWMNYPAREEIDQFAGKSYAPYVAFYVDPGSGASESMSNSTTSSILAGINQFADKSRDMGFLFAHVTSKDMTMYSDKVNESLTKDFAEIQMDSNANNRFNSMITSSAAVLKNGGKMIFPEIWSDSSYTKSYSIDVKLHSPYGDKLSIFLHVLVPFVHLFCMAAPRQLGINGIMSPFLVRAFVKGDFACTMGMVESFSFKKAGSGDGWSIDNLPTSIDVTMSIAELYASLSISRVENLSDALSMGVSGLNYPLSNTMLLDFMANITACDMNVNQMTRKIKLISIYLRSQFTESAGDSGRKIQRSVKQYIGKKLRSLGMPVGF
ncbi:MAG: SH3 domain-containing protein [Cetobacterium sp.]|uniref:SH3 domain-containing protein n=1 Tax=Cetobacterium sp. TaxID=2071632 RepID=UPI003F3A5EEA